MVGIVVMVVVKKVNKKVERVASNVVVSVGKFEWPSSKFSSS